MTSSSVRDWFDENVPPERQEFATVDLRLLVMQSLKEGVHARTMSDICNKYMLVLGVEPGRRVQGNFAQIVFNREQSKDILEAIEQRKLHGTRYAVTFQRMRSARSGEATPSSSQASSLDTSSSSVPAASGGISGPALVQVLTELRSEVAQLRAEVAELRQVGNQSTDVNGVSLAEMRRLLAQLFWRGSVTTVNLSHPDGLEKVESLMEYLGVPSPDDEGVQMQELGVDEVFEKIAKAAAKDASEDEQVH